MLNFSTLLALIGCVLCSPVSATVGAFGSREKHDLNRITKILFTIVFAVLVLRTAFVAGVTLS
jgi:hypothetical protein